MNPEYLMQQLAAGMRRIPALVENVSDEQARWKPAPDSWSVLEVICHLLDEERCDFRPRLDHTLHQPGDPWPKIDPQGWVAERKYNERDLQESLQAWLAAREESLSWLKAFSSPDWTVAHEAPFGEITAGDVFASWAAHDLLHARQLVELAWAYLQTQVEPYRTLYAGEW